MGAEILKLDSTLAAPSSLELNVTSLESVKAGLKKYAPKTVLHLAAATNPPDHEKNPALGLEVNIIGTANVALACARAGIRLVYTSSDYLYSGPGPHKENEPVRAPNNFYLSKLGGECAARLCPNSLILRLSFGPAPFPWEKVYKGQWVSKLYVSEAAPLVLAAAKTSATGIMNLGGPKTTLEDYARRTRKDIGVIDKPEWVPEDLSLDVSRMKEVLGIADEQQLIKLLQ